MNFLIRFITILFIFQSLFSIAYKKRVLKKIKKISKSKLNYLIENMNLTKGMQKNLGPQILLAGKAIGGSHLLA
tara:strand:- start:364 stop:585 length:222 start_codon:yes stop_codon:yes gene_type:complete